jgi:phospholipid transport system substrate-binding protein
MLIRTYSAALQDYRAPEIRYFPAHISPDGRRATVRTRITRPGTQQVVDVQYRLFMKDGQWKVFDVVIDGVSLAANYRTSFDREIRQVGLDGLIERLTGLPPAGPVH